MLGLALALAIAAQPVTPAGLVYSSTSGASLPRLDPACTAELCPIYREAAFRFSGKADACAARAGLVALTCPTALPAIAQAGLSWSTLALAALASAIGASLVTASVMLLTR